MPTTALGFRVKTGWTAAVVIAGPSTAPTVLHARHLDLSDPHVPESRQPYHAVNETQGEFEQDEAEVRTRVQAVRRITTRSVRTLMAVCEANGWALRRAGIVAGSLTDPSKIHHPHIRAHAMEGRLFRTVLEDAVKAHKVPCFVLGEKTVFEAAREAIHRPEAALRRTLADLGKRAEGPWRAEEKLATLAAWIALRGT